MTPRLFLDLNKNLSRKKTKKTATTSSPLGSFLDLGPASPLLVQLSSRPWGASARLEPGQLPLPPPSGPSPPASGSSAPDSPLPTRVAVLREPFSPAGAVPRPLSQLVARLADGAAAVR